ncbi:50S ribosomal protein L4, partial [Candidatus Dojkabacteria bacterium]|nr:50S ribosomal protein L4 [Candidatus Dojkabacteria bacterium]
SNWKRSLNKKMNTKAICGLLSEIRRNDSLVIVKFPSSKEIKTIRNKNLKYFEGGKSYLFITDDEKEKLAFRNVKDIDVLNPQNINVYDLARNEILVVSENAIEKLNEILIKD